MATTTCLQLSGTSIVTTSHVAKMCFLRGTASSDWLFYSVCILLKHAIWVGGAAAYWLACWATYRAGQDQALAGVTALCFWARHFTLTVPLSTQEYFINGYRQIVGATRQNAGDLASLPRGTRSNTPSHFMLLKPELSTGSYEPVWLKRLYFLLKLFDFCYLKLVKPPYL